MKVRILTPTADPTEVDLPTPPRRGDHILLAGDVLEVQRVEWSITRYIKTGYGELQDAVEVVCALANISDDDESVNDVPKAQVADLHNYLLSASDAEAVPTVANSEVG